MYPGGKNGAGIYQTLINLIPPHDIYIEAFLGSGAIMRHKKPARHNIGCDLSQEALKLCKYHFAKKLDNGPRSLIKIDALEFIRNYNFKGNEFVYCDPPYHPETRSNAKIYAHETNAEYHRELLELLITLPCMVMISGYEHPLYDELLKGWSKKQYLAPTRAGHVTETVWFNYPVPVELHDYNHMGNDFRERERIRRKIARHTNRLKNLPAQERMAILAALHGSFPTKKEHKDNKGLPGRPISGLPDATNTSRKAG